MAEIKIDKTLNTTKPDGTGRLKREMDTYELLDKLGIEYIRIDHEPTATIEFCHDVEQVLEIEICKNLLLCNSQKTKFYILMMPGSKRFNTSALSSQINSSRLSFADGEYMERFLHITPGALSIMGLMNDKDKQVNLLIDKDAINSEYLGCHPCVNTSSLKLRTKDIFEKFLPYTGHIPVIVEL